MRCLRPFLSALAFTAVLLPSSVSAQDAERTPDQEYRQMIMDGFDVHFGGLRAIIGGDVAQAGHMADHAVALNGLANMLGDVFPEGSGEGTRAMAEIWSDWDGFMEKVAALQAATAAMVEAVDGGDEAAIGDAVREVGMSCRSCHQAFRARRN